MESVSLSKTKSKFWWLDIILYIVLAFLALSVFCYLIFVARVFLQNRNMSELERRIAAFSTEEVKFFEKEVSDYKKKIDDFALIINNHEISSNVFSLIEQNTLLNVWFGSFDMSQSSDEVKLSGQAENMATLSRQVQIFEKGNDYIKDITVLSSQIDSAGKVFFNLAMLLDPKVFEYANSSSVSGSQ